MSVLQDRNRSANTGQVPQFCMDNAQLPTKHSHSQEPLISGPSVTTFKQSSSDSNLMMQRTQLGSYDICAERKFSSQLDALPYSGQPILNMSVQPLLNTVNSNFPASLPQPIQRMPTSSGTNYFDPFSQHPGTMSNPNTCYSTTDYTKCSYLNGTSEFQQQPFQEFCQRGQTAQHATQLMRPWDSPYLQCSSALDPLQQECISNDLRNRCGDLTTRTGRSGFPVYHMNLSDDSPPQMSTTRNGTGVDLLVSNLDYNISPKEWRKMLFTQLQTLVKSVQSVMLQTQADGSNCAIIRVGSIEDARLAISHFHRKKIGYKRIQMNIISPNGPFVTKGLKADVVSLLRSVSGSALPVSKFIDLFAKRFHRNISASDLYKMRDVIEIKDQPGSQGGRIVSLSLRGMRLDGVETTPLSEPVVCQRHCLEGSPEYLQAVECSMLPSVQIPLSLFRQQVLTILQDHDGSLPLLSFPACYKAEFGDLPTVSPQISGNSQSEVCSKTMNHSGSKEHSETDITGHLASCTGSQQPNVSSNSQDSESSADPTLGTGNEILAEHPAGVPLEHLLTCVPSVRIHTDVTGVRKIILEPEVSSASGSISQQPATTNSVMDLSQKKRQFGEILSPGTSTPGSSTPGVPNTINTSGVLLDHLHQFSREVVDLLKHQPGCQILLGKFIPSYHHHFGKQCRVADYGYSKLHELIDALPNVVHVMGSGHMRLLTLSHRVQVRRFTNELIKVLKSQSTKSCKLTDYTSLYRRIYRKDFRITDYGVCFLTDMLMEVSDNVVEVSHIESDCIISLPKRVQTTEERERTELFAIEVADLLCQSPRCRLPFNKFIPSYHHHFSRQCRVADYGFTKLVDLLEAIPNVVRIVEEHGEKYVTLVRHRHLRIVAEHLLNLLESAPGKRILLNDLPNVYMKQHGYPLCLEDFQLTSVNELLSKLPRLVRIQSVPIDCPKEANSSPVEKCDKMLVLRSEPVSDRPDTTTASAAVGDANPNEAEQIDEAKGATTEPLIVESTGSADRNVVEYVCLADRTQIKHLAHKVLLILLEAPLGALSVPLFSERFRCTFRDEPNVRLIYEELGDIVQFRTTASKTTGESSVPSSHPSWNELPCRESSSLLSTAVSSAENESETCNTEKELKGLPNPGPTDKSNSEENQDSSVCSVANLESPSCFIVLRPLIMFAKELRELLRQNQGKLLLVQLCAVYQRRFGLPLKPQRYNYPSLATLLQAVDFVAVMRGRGVRCTLVLCQDFLGKLSYRVAYNTKPVLEADPDMLAESELKLGSVTTSGDNSFGKFSAVQTPPNHPMVAWSHTQLLDKYSGASIVGLTTTSTEATHSLNPSQEGSFVSDMHDTSGCTPASQTGLPNHRHLQAYANSFASHSLDPCNQFHSFVSSPHIPPSNPVNYYQLPLPQQGSLSQQMFSARSTYTAPLVLNPPSSYNYLATGTEYGPVVPQQSAECQANISGSYGPVVYSPQVSQCGSLTVLPTTSTMQSNPCFVGPGGETANGSLNYPSSMYPSSSIYPYSFGLNYPTTMQQMGAHIHCGQPTTTIANIMPDGRHQALGVDPNISSPARPTGAAFYGQDKVPYTGLSCPATFNLTQYGVSPGVQEQLDELVERLTYGSANTNPNRNTTSTHPPDSKDEKQTLLSENTLTQNKEETSPPSVKFTNQTDQPASFSANVSGSAVGCLPTQCQPSFVSSFLHSHNSQLPYFPGGMFPNFQSSIPFVNDQYPMRTLTNPFASLESGIRGTSTASVPVRIGATGNVDGNTKLRGDLADDNKSLDQSLRSLENCTPLKQMMANIVAPNTISANVNSNERGDATHRYPNLHSSADVFPLDRCSNSSATFSNPNGNGAIQSETASSLTISKEKDSVIAEPHRNAYVAQLPSEPNGLCSQRSRLAAPFSVSISSEDSAGNFSLDGLLAELRLEEKQQQQQQRNPHSSTCGAPDMDLKQNTRILMNNFGYL
ncbi:hypothetical protein CRM22_011049 [Opisthorchis felineus]|uniref:HTH OST-type domain-containing protein n=1 Tax=Opisthorchis felineus TaxID=147828 RepID=A0A4S2KD78_OPIFE|nr:hypothetical protein CRM22_011049 [Opisthorchis felineus]